MADETLTAMTPPAGTAIGTITQTRAGVPYRLDVTGLVYVKAEDVTEMTNLGFAAATSATVGADDPGADVVVDQGWAVAD